ncbi:MAG TPA: hypothetical protein VNJ52_08515 [Patescibacteria group bacterium]|nr:hypothetical protein [Patescibacteria group bacterium]
MTPTEYCRTELKIPGDSRALGAVRGAIQHTARHLGLSSDQEDLLIAVTDQLLRSALDSLGPEEALFVGIQEHADHIEIELKRPGENAGEWAALRKLAGIDEVERETGADGTRLKLVKFLPGKAPGKAPSKTPGKPSGKKKPPHLHN